MAGEIITIDMMKGSAKEWALNQEKLIRKEIIKWFILLLLSLAMPVLMLLFKPESETAAAWFQRSGSIMVVLALLAEIGAVTIDRLIIARDHSFLSCHMYIEQLFASQLNWIKYSSYLVVAVGTVIWGFGDLLYSAAIGL